MYLVITENQRNIPKNVLNHRRQASCGFRCDNSMKISQKTTNNFNSIRYYVIILHTSRFDLRYRTYCPGTVWNRRGLAEVPHFDKMGGITINERGEN